jgi:hypothetical protein
MAPAARSAATLPLTTALGPATGVPDSVAALDAALADLRAKLAAATQTVQGHQERCDHFVRDGDEASYVKEKFQEERSKLVIRTLSEQIRALESMRPEIVAREAAERLRARRAELADASKKFQRVELKRIEEAIAALCELLPREAALYAKIAEFNQNLPAGVEPLESPEAALRYEPGVSERQNGTRKVKRSRLRPGMERSPGGSNRYEVYDADEPVIIPAVPEFRPAPLFRRVIVPSFRRDGPCYSPAGVQLPPW